MALSHIIGFIMATERQREHVGTVATVIRRLSSRDEIDDVPGEEEA